MPAKKDREQRAAEALADAKRLALQEAARVRLRGPVLDPEGVAGLAAHQWLRSGRKYGLAGLRSIVRCRLIDDLRMETGYRPKWGCRHAIETISFETLQPRDHKRVMTLAAPERRRAPEDAADLVGEIFRLPLDGRQEEALSLMLAFDGCRRRVWEAMDISESRLAQILARVRALAMGAADERRDLQLRDLLRGGPRRVQQVDDAVDRGQGKTDLQEVRSHRSVEGPGRGKAAGGDRGAQGHRAGARGVRRR